MSALAFAGWCAAAVAAWLAVYRLPFGDSARRRRTALWLADRTGLRPDPAFAVFATVLYAGLGIGVLVLLLGLAHLSFRDLIGSPPPSAALDLVLAMAGTSSLNILCVSVLYRARPAVDVPGEIARVQWISSILSLPRHFRWIVPATAALVEELVFRGAVFLGLGARGAGFLAAGLFSTAVFTLGQIVLVSTPVQAYVLGTSSATLGVVGTLLIAATGSVVPAVVLHMSFAGFYTNLSAAGSARGAGRPRGVAL